MYSLLTPLLTIIKKIGIHAESSTVSVELDHHHELRSYKLPTRQFNDPYLSKVQISYLK